LPPFLAQLIEPFCETRDVITSAISGIRAFHVGTCVSYLTALNLRTWFSEGRLHHRRIGTQSITQQK
jgi:hypothetical protein